MTDPQMTTGLMIETTNNRYTGKPEVKVRVMLREVSKSFPINGCGTEFEDLVLEASFSDHRTDWTHLCVEYQQPFRVTASLANKMAKLLNKIERLREKTQAYEAGDTFMAFAKAVGATWVAEATSSGSRYSDMAWRWRTVEDGRDVFRRQIDAVRKEMPERVKEAA